MRLIKNEWIKIWSQRNSWIMFILVLVGVVGFAGLNKYFEPDVSTKEARVEANEEWLTFYKDVQQSPGMTEEDIAYYEEEILKTQYRIDNDLVSEDTMFFQDHLNQSISVLMALVGIFTMVITAAIVSNEFGTGTIKMLLTRPVARWKILLSKLVASLVYGVTLFIAGIVLAIGIGLVLFPAESAFTLSVVDGQVVKETIESTYGKTILYGSASNFMTVLFAFMLGSLFGSSTLAVSLALIIMLMGTVITSFIAEYDFAKYIWFANDLSYYAPYSMPIIEDLTLSFSLVVNIVYAIIFLVVTFVYFMRRDITA